MRRVAEVENHPSVARVMMYATGAHVYVFLFATRGDGPCDHDEWYASIGDAEDACAAAYGVTDVGWVAIDDPMPGCQDDWIAPVRVVGREDGTPKWGRFERLDDGVWVEIESVKGTWTPKA